MLNTNLSKDLLKLPLTERLGIMMNYRAAQFLEQQLPISEIEYKALDASIKTTADINAFNIANHAFINLHYHFEHVIKRVLALGLRANYFKTLWMMNRQTASVMEAINYFLYKLSEELDLNDELQDKVQQTMLDALNLNFIMFHEFRNNVDKEDADKIQLSFKEPSRFQDQIRLLDAAIEDIKFQIEAYHKLEDTLNLHLNAFRNALPALLKDGETELEWLKLLEQANDPTD